MSDGHGNIPSAMDRRFHVADLDAVSVRERGAVSTDGTTWLPGASHVSVFFVGARTLNSYGLLVDIVLRGLQFYAPTELRIERKCIVVTTRDYVPDELVARVTLELQGKE